MEDCDIDPPYCLRNTDQWCSPQFFFIGVASWNKNGWQPTGKYDIIKAYHTYGTGKEKPVEGSASVSK